jgi:fumarate reductase flavoprotein subunit
MAQCVPTLTQKQKFAIFDRKTLESWADPERLFKHSGFTAFDLSEIDDADDPKLWKGEDLAQGAQYFGLDPDVLVASVQRYNELCAAGKDSDFGKDPAYLFPIEQKPYYIAHVQSRSGVMIGGIETDMNWQAVDQDRNPIPNLYALGTDGCMLFKTIYSFDTTCAACGAAMIYSGRKAGQHAAQVIKGSN